jgi:hypothetical protein
MGVPRDQLPSWDNIQFVTGQLASVPELDHGQAFHFKDGQCYLDDDYVVTTTGGRS